MRKTTIFILALFFIFANFQISFGKKEKTGKVKGNVFFDKKFGYQLTFLENWKLSTEKEPSLVRATLMKKNYQVDRSTRFGGYEVNIPTIIILADTTSLSLEEFKNAILQESKKIKIKNLDEYTLKLEFLINSELLQQREILVDSIPAFILTFKKRYFKTSIDETRGMTPEGTEVIVEEFIAGHIVFFKKEKNIFLVHFSCERQFIGPNHREFTNIMSGWEFKDLNSKFKIEYKPS